jgi:hypothetical protein
MASNFEIECALMAGYAYQTTRSEDNILPGPEAGGWSRIGSDINDATGFEAYTFKRGDEIVIAFAGTYPEQEGDINTNGHLATGNPTAQLREAVLYYLDVKT